jgi:hypothetical protein
MTDKQVADPLKVAYRQALELCEELKSDAMVGYFLRFDLASSIVNHLGQEIRDREKVRRVIRQAAVEQHAIGFTVTDGEPD